MSARPTRTARHRPTPSTLLRGLTVMGLLGDVIVHHHLAAGYQEASPARAGWAWAPYFDWRPFSP
jgi:hypothetical protein